MHRPAGPARPLPDTQRFGAVPESAGRADLGRREGTAPAAVRTRRFRAHDPFVAIAYALLAEAEQ
ncbi:hypothetical protein [Streptomyces sp. NPDC059787]|uniref:hypothetical protein n=1 Tax=Streptomyces sp. NPDC059787 TaxID=3346947 RepID=UPI0036696CB7